MKISPKRFVVMRHEEFRSRALPVLQSIGFEKCPMGKPYWGSEPYGGFQYDLCRLCPESILELVTVYIIRRDRRLQLMYNQVQISPSINDLSELRDVDYIPFLIPPAFTTQMQIPPPRWLGEPFWPPPYKVALWRLWFGIGVQQAVRSAITRMIRDLKNLERFVRHWEKTSTRVVMDLNEVGTSGVRSPIPTIKKKKRGRSEVSPKKRTPS